MYPKGFLKDSTAVLNEGKWFCREDNLQQATKEIADKGDVVLSIVPYNPRSSDHYWLIVAQSGNDEVSN